MGCKEKSSPLGLLLDVETEIIKYPMKKEK